MAMNPVKSKLREGKPVFGAVMATPSLGNMQVLSRSGLDWVWIDMEHGPINLESAHALILATQGTPAIPIVRIPWKEEWMAKRVMDAGAMGVVFPFIKTREEAEAAEEQKPHETAKNSNSFFIIPLLWFLTFLRSGPTSAAASFSFP